MDATKNPHSPRKILLRSLYITCVATLLVAIAVYFGNDWFFDRLLPAFGIGRATGSALGTFLAMLAAILAIAIASRALFHDEMFGVGRMQQRIHEERTKTRMLVDEVAAALDLFVALLHGELEVEDAAPASPCGQPVGHDRCDSRRLFDHVANHPFDGFFRPPSQAVGAQVLDEPCGENGRCDGPVVDGRDTKTTADKLPAPSTGGCTEIDGREAGAQR